MPKKLFVIGVGPGDPNYITQIAKEKILISKYIIGYRYTLRTIENLIDKEKETIFRGKMIDLENKTFSDLSVMVIDQNKKETYLNFN